MDGNRRFAKEQGKSALEGHKAGFEKLKEVLRWAKDAGVGHVVAYAFSSENWSRAASEVSYLLDLMRLALQKEFDDFKKEGGILHCVGDVSRFPEDLQKLIQKAEEETASNSGPHLYLALSYGGRAEIVHAVKRIVKENPKPEEVTEEYFAKHLFTQGMPDPDLIIRTSGEKRLSGFLPWQSVYSELFFVDTYWPAFSKEEFEAILREYGERERRFGV